MRHFQTLFLKLLFLKLCLLSFFLSFLDAFALTQCPSCNSGIEILFGAGNKRTYTYENGGLYKEERQSRSQPFVHYASSTGATTRNNNNLTPMLRPKPKSKSRTKTNTNDRPYSTPSLPQIELDKQQGTSKREESLIPTKIQESKVLPLEQPSSLWDKFFVKSFLPPYLRRDTYRYEVSKDVYMFEQIQNFFNVTVNIRMTVLRMENGNLFVHAPVAPTNECINMLKELGGEVEYIVLPVTAIEHKVYMKPFVEQVSKKGVTKIYVAPGQFSFPIDLPLGFQIEDTLDNGKVFPFSKEIDHVGFFYQPFTGYISEVAFLHKRSKTLLLTDGAIYINPNQPPDVVKEQNIDGDLYKKMCLQACFLGPPNIPTFDLISNRLIVSPIVRILVYSRAKEDVKQWIKKVLQWKFTSIIPAHFAAPIIATPKDLEKAYDFLLVEDGKGKDTFESRGKGLFDFSFFFNFFENLFVNERGDEKSKVEPSVVLPEEDLAILNFLDNFVTKTGLAE